MIKPNQVTTESFKFQPISCESQEQGGTHVKTLMQKSNPMKTKCCVSADCLACNNGRGKGGECSRNNVGYVFYCNQCGIEEVLYVGEH